MSISAKNATKVKRHFNGSGCKLYKKVYALFPINCNAFIIHLKFSQSVWTSLSLVVTFCDILVAFNKIIPALLKIVTTEGFVGDYFLFRKVLSTYLMYHIWI